MNIEMLDLSSTILSHPKDYLQPRRQELVQFGWYHLKSEESTARPHAFRNVTCFLQNFDVPPKLVVQVPTRFSFGSTATSCPTEGDDEALPI